MASIAPRLTKLEFAFTLCMASSLASFLGASMIRFVAVNRPEGVVRQGILVFLYFWLAALVLAAISGCVAMIAGGRLLMILPFLFVGYILCVLLIVLLTPYSNTQTLEQLIAAEFAIYAGFYLFWLALLKIPLPRLCRPRRPSSDPFSDWT